MKDRQQANADLKLVRLLLKAWCKTYNANARLEVCYHADVDDDDSDEE